MRYLVAMVFAIVAAGLAMFFVSSPIATWVVAQFTFESPDEVADLHTLVFMATNIAALLIGFLIGWVVGGPLSAGERPR